MLWMTEFRIVDLGLFKRRSERSSQFPLPFGPVLLLNPLGDFAYLDARLTVLGIYQGAKQRMSLLEALFMHKLWAFE